MEFSIKALSPEKKKTGCLVLGAWQGGALTSAAQAADKASRGHLSSVIKSGDLSGRSGSTLLLHRVPGLAAERVLLVGLGEEKKFAENAFREAVRTASNALRTLGASDATVAFLDLKVAGRALPWNVRQAVSGIRDVFYRFDKLKTQKVAPAPALKAVTLALAGTSVPPPAERALKEAMALADGVDFAKTLGNLPPNICTPTYLAEQARKLAREFKLGLQVLEQRDMEKLGMGALLAVSRGSRQPPKLIVLKYMGGPKKQKPIVYVGKGITFDTGGISLKTAGDMDEMKFDMSGAGSVLGTMRALAGMRAPLNAIGVVATCENMPDGNATRPGDIVTTLSGQTVEILNTDAEGRLVLADLISYTQERFKPRLMIDLATLTGAIMMALGKEYAGLFCNDEKLANDLLEASAETGEKIWRMPLDKAYDKMVESKNADIKNIGGRWAGACTAAAFIKYFVKDTPWAHIDIAGTAMDAPKSDINPSWGSGWGVRLLDRFVSDKYEKAEK